MELSPEEKKRIYEEEKARIEAREKIERAKHTGESGSTTNLKPNMAALLCYAGFWVTGIVFLFIERKNKLVRFHAMQSLVTFGILNIIWGVADSVRWSSSWMGWGGFFYPYWVAASVVFGIFFTLWWVLWGVSMYKVHHGRFYKIPLFGDLAEACLAKLDGIEIADIKKSAEYAESLPPEPPPAPAADLGKRIGDKVGGHFRGTRAGRIAASSAAIAWGIILLVFFHFFSRYVAYYDYETVNGVAKWNIYPLLTEDFGAVLPILTATLILSVVGHSILLALDKYLARQITLIVLNLFGMATVLTFISVFPLDFSPIPNTTVAAVLPTVVLVALICVTVGLGVGALVRFIKLMVGVRRERVKP